MPVLQGPLSSPILPSSSLSSPTMSCFGQFLSNPKLACSFASYMQSIYSGDELEFWLDVELFRHDGKRCKKQLARDIYDKYLSKSSPQPIHVDSDALQEVTLVISLLSSSPNECDVQIFDKAQDAVESVLVNDCLLRFKEVLRQNNGVSFPQCPSTLASKLHRYYKVRAQVDSPICKAHINNINDINNHNDGRKSSYRHTLHQQLSPSIWASLLSAILPSSSSSSSSSTLSSVASSSSTSISPPPSPHHSPPLPTRSYNAIPPSLSLSPPPSPPKDILIPPSTSPKLSVVIPSSPSSSPHSSPSRSSQPANISTLPSSSFSPTPISPIPPEVFTGFLVANPSSSSFSPSLHATCDPNSTSSSQTFSSFSSLQRPSSPTPLSPTEPLFSNNNFNTSSSFILAKHRGASNPNINFQSSTTNNNIINNTILHTLSNINTSTSSSCGEIADR